MLKYYIAFCLIFSTTYFFAIPQLSSIKKSVEAVEAKGKKKPTQKELKRDKKTRKARRRMSYEEEFDNLFVEENVSLVATAGGRKSRKAKNFRKKDYKFYYGIETGVGIPFGQNFTGFDSSLTSESGSLTMFSNKFYPLKFYVECIPQKSTETLNHSFHLGYTAVFLSSNTYTPDSIMKNNNYIMNAIYRTDNSLGHVFTLGYDFVYKTLFLSGIDITKLYIGTNVDVMMTSFNQQVSYRSTPIISSVTNTYHSTISRKYGFQFHIGIGARTGIQFRATPNITVDAGVMFKIILPTSGSFTTDSFPNIKGFDELAISKVQSFEFNATYLLNPYIGVKYAF